MTGYLLAALIGVPVGWVLKCVALVAGEYLDRTPASRPARARPSAGRPGPLERRYTAADVLGVYDLGARWQPPTFRPDLAVTDRLAAWERRHGRAT